MALVLSAWLSGLVLAAEGLPFESPLALRHSAEAPLPVFEPPAAFCEPLFVEQGCFLREDLSPAQHRELEGLLEQQGQEVERWRAERRWALLTPAWWQRPWPLFAVLWTGAAALAMGRLGRITRGP